MRENRTYSLSGGRRPARKRASSDPTPVKLSNKERAILGGDGGGKGEDQGEHRSTQHEPDTEREASVTGIGGVREAAKERKQERFTALLHHVTYRSAAGQLLRPEAESRAGSGWGDMGGVREGLEGRLADLHGRVHRGAYRAQPSRRVYIPKADGRQRPLGIAALEDKIVQQAVVTILNEHIRGGLSGFSYGFRPGRGQHDALDALNVGIQRKRVNWILDADIRGFFDQMSHEWTVKFVEHRIGDPRIIRLIQKWLKAGVSKTASGRRRR